MSEIIIEDNRLCTCPTCASLFVEEYSTGDRSCWECGNWWHHDLMREKVEINKKRQWGEANPDGSVDHLR